jgi:hypothetical protein
LAAHLVLLRNFPEIKSSAYKTKKCETNNELIFIFEKQKDIQKRDFILLGSEDLRIPIFRILIKVSHDKNAPIFGECYQLTLRVVL